MDIDQEDRPKHAEQVEASDKGSEDQLAHKILVGRQSEIRTHGLDYVVGAKYSENSSKPDDCERQLSF